MTDCRSNTARMCENQADDFLNNPLSFVTVADKAKRSETRIMGEWLMGGFDVFGIYLQNWMPLTATIIAAWKFSGWVARNPN